MEKENYKVKYDLATNFDRNLISGIRKIDTDRKITTIFGKLRKDIVGGGRSSMMLPEVSFKELREYIELCHKNDLKFNYLINPACLGNREMNPIYHRKIVKYIDKLCNAGIDKITVNSPYLCELIKKQFPNLYVSIGVHAGANNTKHIKYWEELGGDEITLPHETNRNFKEIENILTYTKGRNVNIRLIANNACLHECPYRYSHITSQAHASQKGSASSNLNIDYNMLSCNNKKLANPENIIASEWIRPEDVHLYEEICNKVGNYKFSLKLVDRKKTTDFLLRVVTAYTNQNYDGNLLDILNWTTKSNIKVLHKIPMYWTALTNRYKMGELLKYSEAFNLPNIVIDNKKLDGFIDKFLLNSDCFDKICGKKEDVGSQNAKLCFHCLSWAKKSVSCDQTEVNQWMEKSNNLLETLRSSKFFINK